MSSLQSPHPQVVFLLCVKVSGVVEQNLCQGRRPIWRLLKLWGAEKVDGKSELNSSPDAESLSVRLRPEQVNLRLQGQEVDQLLEDCWHLTEN